MPVCQRCGKEWPDGYAVCPDDGTQIAISDTATTLSGALAVARAKPSDDDLPPGSSVGEYVIETKLGEGGMGAVYGARHPVIGKRAAVKVIKRQLSASTEAVERFVREAQAVNTIGHPNIVDVFGFGTLPDGRSFFVMEWLEGESLRDRMRRQISFSQSLEVLESIAIALQAAHDAGVVHRDLKPDNVFLSRSRGSTAPHVKLLDFGLAKLQTNPNDARVDHTRTGVVMGTPLYLSPEQAKGIRVDAGTDIYSLGALAYELGCGFVPFTADSAVEIMAKHISEQAPELITRAPWLPPAYVQLVEQMLEKDPRARPPIDDVVARLAAMRAQPEIANASSATWTPVPASSLPPHRAQRPRRGLVIGIAAAVAIAGGGTAVFVLGASRKPAVIASEPARLEPAKLAAVTIDAPTIDAPQLGSARLGSGSDEAETKPVEVKPPSHVVRHGTVAIAISGAPRGDVFIDGKLVAAAVAQTSLELTPGTHRVRVQAAGHQTFEQVVRIEPRGRTSIAVELKPTSINGVHDPFSE